MQREFFRWVTLYHDVLSELHGQDREEAVDVIEDDTRFDRWLTDFQERRRQEMRKHSGTGSSGTRAVSREEMLKRLRAQGEDEW